MGELRRERGIRSAPADARRRSSAGGARRRASRVAALAVALAALAAAVSPTTVRAERGVRASARWGAAEGEESPSAGLIAPPGRPPEAPPAPSWRLPEALERPEPIVEYRIDARLDHSARSVRGREAVTWRNTTPDTVSELQLHLYLNAFKNTRTTFMRESEGSHRGYALREGGWGWIDLTSMRLADGRDLLAAAAPMRPDDGNPDDETVLRVPLPDPIGPGASVTFEAEFVARLPRVFARTGWKNDFYLVGQWFPKLGVYEPAGARGRSIGGWNCHQFHESTEFYADFGAYDVTITVPSEFVVGATGRLAEPPRPGEAGTTVYRYVQEDVHDFAWTADPDYVRFERTFSYAAERDPDEERRMARVLGLDPASIPPAGASDLSGVPDRVRLGDVVVTALLHPERVALADRHFAAAFAAIKYYGYAYGRYPYATLTVVDPAYGGRGAGGMEYPTFITAGSSYVAPRARQSPESVTVHEFGHQYFYGLLASNEFEEAWLDEGLNTYAQSRVMNKAFGPNADVTEIAGVPFVIFPLMEIPRDRDPWLPAQSDASPAGGLRRALFLRWTGASNDTLLNAARDLPWLLFPGQVPYEEPWGRRRRYIKEGPTEDRMLRSSWEFVSRSAYALNVYDKVAITMSTLESLIGPDTVARAMRMYAEHYRFRHPTTDDFVAVVSEAAGRDMGWFFDQTVRGSGLHDVAVAAVKNEPVRPIAGVVGPPSSRRVVPLEETAGGSAGEIEWEVLVKRRGEIRLPVTVEIEFEGGRRETREWDGEYRWVRFRGRGAEKVAAARLVPADGRPLDADTTNDGRTSTRDRWPALKWWTRLVAWAQSVLFFYSGIA